METDEHAQDGAHSITCPGITPPDQLEPYVKQSVALTCGSDFMNHDIVMNGMFGMAYHVERFICSTNYDVNISTSPQADVCGHKQKRAAFTNWLCSSV
jgi:hypothetical protein